MRKFLTIMFLLAFAAGNSYGQVLLTESFDNGGAIPANWNLAQVSGTILGVTFVTTASTGYPAVTVTPYNGTHEVFYNSYSISSGNTTRLYRTAGTSTVGYPSVSLDFAMYHDLGYATYTTEGITPQYSIDGGTTWTSVGTIIPRYDGFSGWEVHSLVLPPNAGNQANLRIGFLFASQYGNNIIMDYTHIFVPTAPGIAGIVSPANGGTGILPTATLNWTAPVTGGAPTGYKLYFGTNNPPTNIVNGTNLGNVLTYDPTPDMIYNTVHYWKVVPTNAVGDATGAPVWSFTTLAGFGSLEGFVLNCYGVPVQGATVAIQGPATYTTTSGTDGKYQFLNVPAATYTLGAQKVGYNTVTLTGITVNASQTTAQNITLTQPGMTVLPNPNNVSVNPNELLNQPFTVTNPGCGPLTWTASIAYGSANHTWFTMPALTGTVTASQNASVPALFNASLLPAGTLLSANVTFTSNPNVGQIIVPVNMVVGGAALVPVTNLTGIVTDLMAGTVALAWECTPGPGFLYYTVKRDGIQIGLVASATTYTDDLAVYGTYNYCVDATYTDGATAPACVAVEWPNPTMTWTPAALAATVWTGTSKNVPMEIGNTGLGTLVFAYPEYADNSGDSPLAYCAATHTVCDEYIGNVSFGTINKSSGCLFYTDYSATTSTDLVKGVTVPMTVTNGGNPYTSDYLYVWIDYNHNNTFDASELTQLATLGGGSNFSGNIAVPATAMSGVTTMRVRMSYATAANPCGTQSYGEVEDYAVNIKAPTFITAVAPATGFVAAGAPNQPVNVTFSATGDYSAPGVYVNQLKLNSNDLAHASVNIPCTMTVTVPGTITGVVTDGMTGEVLPGVMVTAGAFSTMTNDDGAYTFLMDAGTYNLVFTRIGYQTVTVTGTVVTAGNVTTVNAQMFEEPYSPSCASASVNADDTQAVVTWCVPAGPYELLYDDGSAENYAAWQVPGNMNAVKFTPKGYPAKVVGAKLYIGDGSFPAGGVVLGSTFSVSVFSVDAAGKPNTQIGDSVPVIVASLGWINVTGLNSTITSGDFCIVMKQGTMSPNCAPIGVDETAPKAYKSYSRNVGTGSPWVISPYQDFMMHAVVSSPLTGDDDAIVVQTVTPSKVAGMISQSKPNAVPGNTGMTAMVTVPEGYDNTDVVHHYKLSRFFQGAVTPVAPGTEQPITSNITALTYTDGGSTWSALAQGWYAYGVKAVYPNGNESGWVYTNVVPHKMFADVTVNVQLVCGFVPAVGATVSLSGINYPNNVYTAVVPASGTVFFDNVIKGVYDLVITRGGYVTYAVKVTITGNKTINAILEDIKYKPRNLMVECGTLVATWDEPLALALTEDFESGTFPPTGWQATTQGSTGWIASADGGSSAFVIPNHTTYAVSNDDLPGSANNGCCDNLMTPEMDLTGAPSYVLSFQSYYDGSYGQLAYIEMSTNAGATWTTIYNCSPATSWQQVDVDLSAYSGATGLASVMFNFHSDDAGAWASGWAIDDVQIASGGLPIQGYGVFLDGTEVGQTQELTWTYDPTTITYGQTYVAGVAGLYCSGFSELETYTFTSCFLYPPRNLEALANNSTTSGAVILTWDAPLGGDGPNAGMTYQEYVNANNLVAIPDNSPTSTGRAPFVNQAVLPMPTDANLATYSKAWGALSAANFITWRLDTPGTFTTLGTTVPSGFIMEAEIINGVYYGTNDSGSWFSMDTLTGVTTTLGSTGNPNISAMAYDRTTGILYGVASDNGNFYSIDIPTGALTLIGTTSTWIIAATFDQAGTLYAVDLQNDLFGTIDKATAAWTTIAALPFNANYGQDMATDFETNTIYYGAYNATIGAGQEYIVDPVTGTLTLVGNFSGNAQVMGFAIPTVTGGTPVLTNLVGYHIFRNDASLVQVPTEPRVYWDMNLMPGTYCYDITAVYDLTPYGFPGLFGESVKEGTACADVSYGFLLPFTEDWTTGQFDVNLWTVGANWIMDGQAGNLLPSAKFKWDPLLTDYESSLESFYLNATTINSTTPYKIWLDFDLKLDDRTATTDEKLAIEVWNGSSWNKVQEFANNGDFDWTAQHIDISSGAKHKVFKVRFRANGALSGDIFYWAVDNINVYCKYIFNPPLNLVTTPEGTPKNDIKLVWGPPAGGGVIMNFIFDDGSAENGWAINPAAESWLGNEFPVTETGVLQSIDLYWMANAATGNEPLTFDVFDGSQTIVATSAAFVPVADAWQTVALPDVPFSGPFYVMVHWNNQASATNYLGSDENGPNAAANYGWYYDGAAWSHLSDFGYAPNVFTLRAKALVGGDKSVVTYGPASASSGNTGTLNAVKADKGANTGDYSISSATPVGDNSEGLTGYNVYRRAYAKFPAGQNTAGAGTFTMIATVPATEYLDMNLSNLVTNCYEYEVTAVYDEGESDPSNIDWECIFVGVDPKDANQVSVYPNPATNYVRIDLTKEVSSISVYNSLGAITTERTVKGETTITLNLANYAAGAYSVKFTTNGGDTFSRKFVVTK